MVTVTPAEYFDLVGIIIRHGDCAACPPHCTCTYCSEFLGTNEQCTVGPRSTEDLNRLLANQR